MHASARTPKLLLALGYAACCLLWGSTWPVVRIGLADLPPLLFAVLRMGLALLFLAPFALRQGLRSLDRRSALELLFAGTVQIGLVYALQFLAQQWIPSALAAILFATFAVWVQGFSRLLLPGYRLTRAALLAVALGIAGVAVIQLPSLRGVHLGEKAALGAGLMLLGACLCAAVNVFMRKRLSAVPPVVMTAGNLLGGVLVLAIFALWEAHVGGAAQARFTARSVAALVHLSLLGTVATYLTFFWLLPRLTMTAVGTIPLLDTTVAVVIGGLVLHEPLPPEVFAGGALVLFSVGLANWQKAPRDQAFAAAEGEEAAA
jgi:drug/metabolite transporter (DMT)-like permease